MVLSESIQVFDRNANEYDLWFDRHPTGDSGKAAGYYGCLNSSRKSYKNKMLIARSRLEHGFVKALQEKVLSVENIKLILDRTSEKVKDR